MKITSLGSLALLLTCCTALPAQTQRPAITGIAFVRVYVTNLDAAAKFYDGDLGFARTPISGKDVYSVNDSQWFEVVPQQNIELTSRLAAVAFTTRNEKVLEAYMRAHGQIILPQPEPDSFGVKDPEGNLILFVQQGRKHPGAATQAPRATAHRIIHAGFVVHDAAVEDRFYLDLLGFHPQWHGGRTDTTTDYRSVQVPDGSDWLEYMLNVVPNADAHIRGSANHFSLGVANIETVITGLSANHCTDANCRKAQLGKNGKMQLNVFDPDLTRVEYMEFKPIATPCCSPTLGKEPREQEDQ
ncbi:MAG: VOC family protein [Granulicella sp.]